MGTNGPHELLGTAVARPDDIESQLKAYETAMRRLHDAATVRGVFIGEPRVTTEHAPSSAGDHLIIVLVAPVLDTGTDTKTTHTTALWDTPVDDPGEHPAS